jgi:hypothetical protein
MNNCHRLNSAVNSISIAARHIAAAPINHHPDSARVLAQSAQLWREHGAGVERRLVLGELGIAWAQ